MKNAIIGKGNVGNALCNGLTNAGHETKFGHRIKIERKLAKTVFSLNSPSF
jgi:predicted dinucleotide-binding enzyme